VTQTGLVISPVLVKSFRRGLAPFIVSLLLPALCVAQTVPAGSSSPGSPPPPQEQAEERRYVDFFPLTPGMEWLYRIEAPRPIRIMRFREQWWPVDGPRLLDVAGRLETISPTKEKARRLPKELRLQIKMKGLVAAESLPASVFLYVCKHGADTIAEFQIVRDDLKLLGGDGRKFFWIKCSLAHEGRPLPIIYEAARYGVDSFPAHMFAAGSRPVSDGFTVRPVFLATDPGATFLTGTQSRGDSEESLTFLGPVNQGDASRFDLAFRRTVTRQGKTEFTEDAVFSWRRGLTALRQTIAGKTSMEWRLIRISGQ
jgi:hypothetical protein